MNHTISFDAKQMGAKAADDAGELIRKTLWAHGLCSVLMSTGAVMALVLEKLVQAQGIDWSKVTCFHTAEFIGLSGKDPASAKSFLKKRFSDIVKPRTFHYIQGDAKDVHAERRRIAHQLTLQPIDVAILEIGENASLGANDPPAEFEADEPFVVTQMSLKTRQQQVNEKRFKILDDVPHYAITMTLPWIMGAKHVICCAGGSRQAQAVADAMEGEIDPEVPASILQQHTNVKFYLDNKSASKLSTRQE